MFSLLLTLSYFGQWSNGDNLKPVPPHIQELAWNQLQEEWVYEAKHPFYDWNQVLPQEGADLLLVLDSEKMAYRRHARRYLAKLGYDGMKISSWGAHAKSAELNLVCRANLWRLYTCTYCKGTGEAPTKTDAGTEYMSKCMGCYGSGNFLFYERYNFLTGGQRVVERSLMDLVRNNTKIEGNKDLEE